ncbi:hypothetical protein J26TS2_00390 [Shouchella clausii]|nr:hypothetical protein J26TS2_00390 [Shouchella clausii]
MFAIIAGLLFLLLQAAIWMGMALGATWLLNLIDGVAISYWVPVGIVGAFYLVFIAIGMLLVVQEVRDKKL